MAYKNPKKTNHKQLEKSPNLRNTINPPLHIRTIIHRQIRNPRIFPLHSFSRLHRLPNPNNIRHTSRQHRSPNPNLRNGPRLYSKKRIHSNPHIHNS